MKENTPKQTNKLAQKANCRARPGAASARPVMLVVDAGGSAGERRGAPILGAGVARLTQVPPPPSRLLAAGVAARAHAARGGDSCETRARALICERQKRARRRRHAAIQFDSEVAASSPPLMPRRPISSCTSRGFSWPRGIEFLSDPACRHLTSRRPPSPFAYMCFLQTIVRLWTRIRAVSGDGSCVRNSAEFTPKVQEVQPVSTTTKKGPDARTQVSPEQARHRRGSGSHSSSGDNSGTSPTTQLYQQLRVAAAPNPSHQRTPVARRSLSS
jgi:hypothetical protein